jgi:hypothetical protein
MKLHNFFDWRIVFLLILINSLSSHYYFLERYNRRMLLADQTAFLKNSETIAMFKELAPSFGRLYPNGFGMQLLSVLVSYITGISLVDLFNIFYPLQGAVVVLIFFVCVREFLEDNLVALLASILLILQPDFLFITSRATHERFFMISFILMVIFLKRSFSLISRPEFRRDVFMTYIFTLQMLAFNIFFSSSAIWAIILSMFFGLLSYKYRLFKTSFIRLIYVSLICLILTFYFIFYIYTPARIYLSSLKNMFVRSELLVFGLEEQTEFTTKFPQYEYVAEAYEDPRIFLILRLFDFTILPLGFLSAILILRRLAKAHRTRDEQIILLLFMYLGFLAQFVFTILFDRVGLLGENVELRLFPYVHILSIPLAAHLIVHGINVFRGVWKNTALILLVLFIILSTVFSLLKATNDPIVTKKWFFYSDDELMATRWVLANPHKQGIILRVRSIAAATTSYLEYDFSKGHREEGGVLLMSDLQEQIMVNYGVNVTAYYEQHELDTHDVVYDNGPSVIYSVV